MRRRRSHIIVRVRSHMWRRRSHIVVGVLSHMRRRRSHTIVHVLFYMRRRSHIKIAVLSNHLHIMSNRSSHINTMDGRSEVHITARSHLDVMSSR